MQFINYLNEVKHGAMQKNAVMDWETVIMEYFTHHGFMDKIKFELLRNMKDKDYRVEIKLGNKKDFINSLSEFIYNNYNTTMSDEGLYKQFKNFVVKNNLDLDITEEQLIGVPVTRLWLYIPLRNLY